MKKITILSAVAGLTILAAMAVQAQTGGALAALQGYAGAPAPDAPAAKAEVAGGITGYVAGSDQADGLPAKPAEWVTISGGKFTMGTDSGEEGFEDANPAHEVTIKTFQLAKTAVTVAQYTECVSKGACTEPATGSYCNWGKAGRGSHPVNCVDWDQAQAYAKFKGARLPSEAEFEYAATSGGRNQKYPWGNEEPTRELAVFNTDSTMPVCSKPKGNTAQGLCDMSGNVWQWVQDKYQDSYEGAPVDGSAFEGAGYSRVFRGGAFLNDASYLRAGFRYGYGPSGNGGSVGFRLAR
ncbi:MAG TPA: hypothetical protein DCZ93_01525 [Elusimicrobia bacterium]|nr:hypothetical protein [Elusimicrobiota bacterium]